jgi:hypothetical protein
VRQGRDEGVCGALPSVRATWAGRADMGAGLAGRAHAMGAVVAEEEDGSDGQGPRASESERLNGLTSGVRGTVREGNTREGSWRQQIGPTGQRERGGSERAGRGTDRWGPPTSGRGRARSGGLVGPAWAERPRGRGFRVAFLFFLFF